MTASDLFFLISTIFECHTAYCSDESIAETSWNRKWQPTLVFLPGKFHGQRSLAGYIPRGYKQLDMAKHLHIHSWNTDNWQKILIKNYNDLYYCYGASLITQLVKNLPAMQEALVLFLGWEDLWKKDSWLTPVFLGFRCGSAGKESTAMQETWIRSLGWEDPLEKGRATHSSILAWRIPQTI